ncbi:hypothetical protein RchiOBHm_Chr6g0300901 [Rosa chinensis]|uniref:Uncharacterized protein n=1 Tax=Rosa chinensis TaxID=74649 RepID=A0A2P6PYM5_ROSCH|nr:hypothetical protein RchiOBHm_Chr6g0300901 [Rosa chinensis]
MVLSTDDLKQKILSTTLELESVKSLVAKSQQNANKILSLLQVAYKERDEARNELRQILNKMNPNSAPIEQFPNVVPPIFMPPKANSGISESNGIINPQYDSSLVDSLFDALSSPDFSNINDSSHTSFLNQPLTEELIGTTKNIPTGVVASFGLDAKIDYIAKGKSLPQKGKLLQALMEAGPLLKTLLVTGPPLPRWRNPPTMQTLEIPPISLEGCEAILASFNEKPVIKTCSSNHLNSISCPGFSQTCSPAMWNFNNVPPVISCKSSRPLNSSSYFDQQIPAAKQCRLQ